MVNMFSATQLIQDYVIEKAEKGRLERDNTYWHGSDMGMCPKMRFMKRKGVEALQSPTVNDLLNFSVGDVYHKWIQDIFIQSNITTKVEGEVKNDKYQFKGHYDMLVNYEHAEANRINVLFEIK